MLFEHILDFVLHPRCRPQFLTTRHTVQSFIRFSRSTEAFYSDCYSIMNLDQQVDGEDTCVASFVHRSRALYHGTDGIRKHCAELLALRFEIG